MARRIFLHPGELHFDSGDVLIETLLGSCVTVTLRHRAQPVGGMCHFLLPSRPRRPDLQLGETALDARYGDEALVVLMKQLAAARVPYGECIASVYGGANVIRFESNGRPTVGESNISFALERLNAFGFAVETLDVGGGNYRYLKFDLGSGNMHVRHGNVASAPGQAAGSGVPVPVRKSMPKGRK